MAEYEALTQAIRVHGPVSEVLEADTLKLKHIASHWRIELDVLNRQR